MLKRLPTWMFFAILLLQVGHASAQDYPIRPVEFIIGLPAGGATDVLGRALAEGMAKEIGVPVVPINKAGASGALAVGQVIRAKRDGYTVGFNAAGPFVSLPYLEAKLPYKVEDVDFICQTFELPVALAVPQNSPIRTLEDFIRLAKSQPAKVNVGHAGPGTLPQIALAQLEKLAGIQVNQIPFKGDAEVVINLLGGHLDAGAPGLSSIGDKNLRVLAIFSQARVASRPDIPTVKELGYSIVKVGMAGLYAPKGLPSGVRAKLVDACRTAAAGAAYQRVSDTLGQSVNYLGPLQWSARIAEDARENKAVIDQLGIKQ